MEYLLDRKEQIYISERFYRVVTLHILKNMLKKTKEQVPLLLGIHGPSGEGKTFQLEYVLRKIGVKRYVISGGQLESSLSGEPARVIRSTYLRASENILGGDCSMAALLFNDIDTGLGMWSKEAGYSTSQITLYGELMHLVDYPNSVDGKDTLRIPILVTGNDFTKLYKPLVRAGRMALFQWIPTFDERTEILAYTYPELSKEECRRLITQLNQHHKAVQGVNAPELSVAFYGHLRSMLIDEELWGEVERTNLSRTVDRLIKGEEPNFSRDIHFERVLKKGVELINTRVLMDYIFQQ